MIESMYNIVDRVCWRLSWGLLEKWSNQTPWTILCWPISNIFLPLFAQEPLNRLIKSVPNLQIWEKVSMVDGGDNMRCQSKEGTYACPTRSCSRRATQPKLARRCRYLDDQYSCPPFRILWPHRECKQIFASDSLVVNCNVSKCARRATNINDFAWMHSRPTTLFCPHSFIRWIAPSLFIRMHCFLISLLSNGYVLACPYF